MRSNHTLGRVEWGLRCLTAVVLLCGGCVSPWWNSFLDPTEMGNFRENRVTEILRSASFRDKPYGIAGAVDPVPEDLVANIESYKIGPQDQVDIRILDLLAKDVESQFQPLVDDLGYITISQIGRIYVEGMTAEDLELEIKNRVKNMGFFAQESEPTVVVSFMDQRQRLYNLSGAVKENGVFKIPTCDYRLMEGVNAGGGLDQLVQFIYVFRNEPRPKRIQEGGLVPTGNGQPMTPETPAPPVVPVSMAEISASAAPAAGPSTNQSRPTTRATAVAKSPSQNPESRPAANRSHPGGGTGSDKEQDKAKAHKELMEVLESANAAVGAGPGASETSPAGELLPSRPNYIYVNDKFIESPTTAPQAAAPQEKKEVAAAAKASTQPQKVDWKEFVPEAQQRIIKISAERLRNGDSNYNIVIRPGDWIQLETGPTGSFYVMGHVQSPGFRATLSYSFEGQEITIRQAIAQVGGLDDLAWPSRCELARRLDGDRVEITQWNLARIMDGRDPDLYLKPGDVLNVGTHAIAQLLYHIRNSFRMSYGFGFTYDRNFADIDSFSGQQNPTDRRRAERSSRFPGLF